MPAMPSTTCLCLRFCHFLSLPVALPPVPVPGRSTAAYSFHYPLYALLPVPVTCSLCPSHTGPHTTCMCPFHCTHTFATSHCPHAIGPSATTPSCTHPAPPSYLPACLPPYSHADLPTTTLPFFPCLCPHSSFPACKYYYHTPFCLPCLSSHLPHMCTHTPSTVFLVPQQPHTWAVPPPI